MILIEVSSFGLFVSFFIFSKINVHVLAMLVSLEAFILSLLLFIISFCVVNGSRFHLFLILLTFAACEAALGLGLLVRMLRLRGNDFVTSFVLLNFYV